MGREDYACDQMPEFREFNFLLNPEMKGQLDAECSKLKDKEVHLILLQTLRSWYLRLGISFGSIPYVNHAFEKFGPSYGMTADQIKIFGMAASGFIFFKVMSNITEDTPDAMQKEREDIIRPKVRKNLSKLVKGWRDGGLIRKEDSVYFERKEEAFERTFIKKALVGLKFIARTVYVPKREDDKCAK